MNKIGKTALVNRLELRGFNRKETHNLIEALSDIMTEELCKGNTIAFNRVLSIIPSIGKAGKKMVVGIERDVEEHIKCKVVLSKILKDVYVNEYSTKSAKSKELMDFTKNLLSQ